MTTPIPAIPITPVAIWPSTATQFLITAVNVVLSTSASCTYLLQDAAGKNLAGGSAALTPAQYAAWGSDDNYFTTCILQNLGLTPVTPLT